MSVSADMALENCADFSRESGIIEAALGQDEVEHSPRRYDSDGESKSPEEYFKNESCASSSSQDPTDLPTQEIDFGRKSVKKECGFDAVSSQRRRRLETLLSQKQRRDDFLDKMRQLEDSTCTDSETEDEMDFAERVRETSSKKPQALDGIEEEDNQEEMEVTTSRSRGKSHGGKKRHHHRSKNRHSRYREAPCKPMLSEWMLEKPEDFEDSWLGVICPVGKRCIVLASRGKTKVFSRTDEYLGGYKSLLPGGCRYNYGDHTTNRNKGVTLLDCIWSAQSQTFYVLDLICWNSHPCLNCDTDYRQFFLHSKFAENMELLERSVLNPFPFKPLPYFSANEFPSVMCHPILFPEDVDGVLFYHKETLYTSTINPLCLWVVLTQVESLLGVTVSPELLSRQVKPKNLQSLADQIKKRNRNKEMDINES